MLKNNENEHGNDDDINGLSYTENDNCNDNTDSRQSQIQRSWGLKNPIVISFLLFLTAFNRKEHEYLPIHIQIFPYYLIHKRLKGGQKKFNSCFLASE